MTYSKSYEYLGVWLLPWHLIKVVWGVGLAMGLYQGFGFCLEPCHNDHNIQAYLCGGVIRVFSLVSHLSMGFVFVRGDTKWGSHFTVWLSQGLGFRVQGLG